MSQIEFLLTDAICDIHGKEASFAPRTQMERLALRRGYLVPEELIDRLVLTAKGVALLEKSDYPVTDVVLANDRAFKTIAQEKRDEEAEAQRYAEKNAGWGAW